MAKKKRRKPNLSNEALERARRELRGEPVDPSPSVDAGDEPATKSVVQQEKKSAPQVSAQGFVTKRTMSRQELAAEYGYVINDLVSMAVLAFILFIVMVVVSLLIDQII